MKICSICHKNEASVTITSVNKDGQIQELALCGECAQKRGLAELKKIKLSPDEVIAELKKSISEADRELVCSNCNLSYAYFRTTGLLGCEHCYKSFKENLSRVIKEIHNATHHKGKSITPTRKEIYEKFILKKLAKEMRQAIQNENYEKAAVLRDQIRKIKNGFK
jgi:protein arginine kinase activator